MNDAPEPPADDDLDGLDGLTLQPPNTQKALEWLAVLQALSIPHRVARPAGRWRLILPVDAAATALREIEAYEEECRTWPQPETAAPAAPQPRGSLAGGAVALGLIVFFMYVGPGDGDNRWVIAGGADAAAILAGQWYRVLTALTLHADFAHVAANAICLWLLVPPATHRLGEGLTWAAVVLAAAVGNLITALNYGGDHLSIGASTAVFAAVGLLGGMTLRDNIKQRHLTFRGLAVPVLAVLGFVGLLSGGVNTDVAAHLYGAIGGLAIGLVAARLDHLRERQAVQALAATAALAAVAGAWLLAWRTP